MVKVKVIKQFNDMKLRKIQKVNAELGVTEDRAEYLVSQGVAEIVPDKPKADTAKK